MASWLTLLGALFLALVGWWVGAGLLDSELVGAVLGFLGAFIGLMFTGVVGGFLWGWIRGEPYAQPRRRSRSRH